MSVCGMCLFGLYIGKSLLKVQNWSNIKACLQNVTTSLRQKGQNATSVTKENLMNALNRKSRTNKYNLYVYLYVYCVCLVFKMQVKFKWQATNKTQYKKKCNQRMCWIKMLFLICCRVSDSIANNFSLFPKEAKPPNTQQQRQGLSLYAVY